MESLNRLFRDVRYADLEIKCLRTQELKLKESALSLSAGVSEKVSGTKPIGGLYDVVNNYVDLEKYIEIKLQSLAALKKKAIGIIDLVQDPLQRVILFERYINSESWKVIGLKVDRSEGRVKQLHQTALLYLHNVVKEV